MLESGLLVFDGAMGTMLQEKGFVNTSIPEELNIENPEVIVSIHKDYIAHGAQVITTHTFGANAYKLSESKYSLEAIVSAAVDNAKAATEGTDVKIALDLGPIGRVMRPIGEMDFEEAYEYFKNQVVIGVSKGIDVILIETMSDLGEMRAAVLAAKENASCRVFATMTFEADGLSLTGTDPETMVLALEALGVDALGVNCSLGPGEMIPIVRRILDFSEIPVMVQANAGLPSVNFGKTFYHVSPEAFKEVYDLFVSEGVQIIGGCCGTTPQTIQKLCELKDRYQPREIKKRPRFVSSSQKRVNLDNGVTLIGERINPSGNRQLKEPFTSGDFSLALKMAFEQVEKGARVLDINTSLPGVDEKKAMLEIIESFNGLIDAPLQFDTTTPEVIEAALRHYNGVPIINSVNGKAQSMADIFPLVKKYGAYVIALTFDEGGIPKKFESRMAVAQKIIRTAGDYGIDKSRLLIDTLVLTASAQQAEVMETIKAIRAIKASGDILTTLGLSNVSYGLPNRPLINRTYLAMALGAGLDTVIIDPGAPGVIDTLMAFNLLSNQDPDAKAFIAAYANQTTGESVPETIREENLTQMLLKGSQEATRTFTEAGLETHEPLWIVENHLVPALDEVGRQYEERTIYLPQLIRAAETAGVAFELVRKKLLLSGEKLAPKGVIILATVQGDVHDLGKNLVKVLLENYGYEVIDLGKDTSPQKVVEAVARHRVRLVGLSALMTTTVLHMETTIKAIKTEYPETSVFVGGAVLTPEYAREIGADYYGRDARSAVTIADEFFTRKIRRP